MVESNKRICQSVIEIFLGVCGSVIDGTVTLQMLDKFKHCETCMRSLCEAITSKPNVGKGVKVAESLTNWQTFTHAQITTAMEKRRKEYRAFEVYHQNLCYLFNHIRDLNVQG